MWLQHPQCSLEGSLGSWMCICCVSVAPLWNPVLSHLCPTSTSPG